MENTNWSNFIVSASSISAIMSRPRGCTNLTNPQKEKFALLQAKDELTEAEAKTMEVLTAKKERFENPELSVAAKKYLITRYSWEKYNRGTLPVNDKAMNLKQML